MASSSSLDLCSYLGWIPIVRESLRSLDFFPRFCTHLPWARSLSISEYARHWSKAFLMYIGYARCELQRSHMNRKPLSDRRFCIHRWVLISRLINSSTAQSFQELQTLSHMARLRLPVLLSAASHLYGHDLMLDRQTSSSSTFYGWLSPQALHYIQTLWSNQEG